MLPYASEASCYWLDYSMGGNVGAQQPHPDSTLITIAFEEQVNKAFTAVQVIVVTEKSGPELVGDPGSGSSVDLNPIICR
jgi:hypothetical protein